MSYTDFGPGGISIVASRDCGATWSPPWSFEPATIVEDIQWSVSVVGSDWTVYVF